MSIILTVGIVAGTDINQAIKDARDLADKMDVLVSFNFNGVYMVISSKSNICDSYNNYISELNSLANIQRNK